MSEQPPSWSDDRKATETGYPPDAYDRVDPGRRAAPAASRQDPSQRDAPQPGASRAADTDGWYAVVYGRTHRVDEWWRALPPGMRSAGPVGRAVRAAVAGGRRLAAGPRLLLARGAHGVLVGAACRIDLIDSDMATEQHGRPLYGFVGWHHPDPRASVPAFTALAEGFAPWAGAAYRQYVAPVWRARSAPALMSAPQPSPWPARTAPPVPPAHPAYGAPSAGATGGADAQWLPAQPYTLHLLPQTEARWWWDAAAGSGAPCVLATGWQESRDADRTVLTHVCGADVTVRRTVRHSPPAPPRAPQAQAPPPAQAPAPPGERADRPRQGLCDRAKRVMGIGSADGGPPAPAQGGQQGDVPRPGGPHGRDDEDGFFTGMARVVGEFVGFGRPDPPRQEGFGGLTGPAAYEEDVPYDVVAGGTAPRAHPPRHASPPPHMPPPRHTSAPEGPVFGRTRQVSPEDASAHDAFDEWDDDPPAPTGRPSGGPGGAAPGAFADPGPRTGAPGSATDSASAPGSATDSAPGPAPDVTGDSALGPAPAPAEPPMGENE
ncbi:hypothetical protein JCM4814A_33770 [Streptomyces phaeofaciens JCM 4814]|uniref:Uncharacterized protein n=1 Tax=Streptomyces phaeofaciens TaxID=68254 RepID=A0A918HLK0_9ACTN|nr:hypothetical protein [Streptomyces phaeofaciens]GGT78175.1 hypothetical protein GCM10010226_65600 [Streptomyces phaeofaciens]